MDVTTFFKKNLITIRSSLSYLKLKSNNFSYIACNNKNLYDLIVLLIIKYDNNYLRMCKIRYKKNHTKK